MPLLRRLKLDEDEEKLMPRYGSAGIGAAGQPAGATAAGGQPPQASQRPGGFVGLQDYLRANQGQAQGMADKVLGGIESAGNKALGVARQSGLAMGEGPTMAGRSATQSRPGGSRPVSQALRGMQDTYAREAESKSGLLGSTGGVQELLGQEYKGAYSSGESALDAGLMGGVAGERMAGLKKRYSGLTGMLQKNRAAIDAANAAAAETAKARKMADKYQDVERTDEGPRNVGTGGEKAGPDDRTDGSYAGQDPNTLSDEVLDAQGWYASPAPGESYAHYSDRMDRKKGKGVK